MDINYLILSIKLKTRYSNYPKIKIILAQKVSLILTRSNINRYFKKWPDYNGVHQIRKYQKIKLGKIVLKRSKKNHFYKYN